MIHVDDYIRQVEEKDCPGLITCVHEWIVEGWRLDEKPTPEQLAAAIFMEANTQDKCVVDGDSAASYPKLLRAIAHQILRLCGHGDVMVPATYVVVVDASREIRQSCLFCPMTFLVRRQESVPEGNITEEFVELADGNKLSDEDGVVFTN